jgi:hypothetical protein
MEKICNTRNFSLHDKQTGCALCSYVLFFIDGTVVIGKLNQKTYIMGQQNAFQLCDDSSSKDKKENDN